MIDGVDRKIMKKLQENARISTAQIARELNMAPSGIHERIKRLERHGIIKGYHVSLDAGKLGYGVTAFLMIRTDDRMGSISAAER